MSLLIFSTEEYNDLADAVCKHGNFSRGEVERKPFPDGERYQRVREEVSRRDVVLLGGTTTDSNTLELYDLACGLVQQGVHTLTLMLPWFGYQTMERAISKGDLVVAKTRARLLSSIPSAGSGNRVVILDLHTEGIAHYFEGNMRAVSLHARELVLHVIRTIGGAAPYIVASTDAGRAKWVESLANALGVDAAFVFKRRISGDTTEVSALAADVRGKNVIIYDDMVRTGSSLVAAARAFRDAGATRVDAVCTHGVLPGNSLSRIRESGALESLIVTDSRPHAVTLADGNFLRVVSVAPTLADFLLSDG